MQPRKRARLITALFIVIIVVVIRRVHEYIIYKNIYDLYDTHNINIYRRVLGMTENVEFGT